MKNRFTKALFCAAAAFLSAFLAPLGAFIEWRNPSFEGEPERSKCPVSWVEAAPGSTPDIQPGAWGVQSPSAKDGRTYLGLIAREDGSRESIGQVLPEKLKAGKCYRFSVWVAHASSYTGYDLPLRLRVLGGSSSGSLEQTLAASQAVSSEKWTEFTVRFTAKSDISFIAFEADYAPGALKFYKGNILLDHLSPIERCERA